MRYILTVLLLFTVFGCNDMASYEYRPHKGIELQINFKDAKYSQENKATFLSFDLQIQNDASGNVYFNPSRLQAKVNNTISQATYHDSLASVMPERKVLKKGKNSFIPTRCQINFGPFWRRTISYKKNERVQEVKFFLRVRLKQ